EHLSTRGGGVPVHTPGCRGRTGRGGAGRALRRGTQGLAAPAGGRRGDDRATAARVLWWPLGEVQDPAVRARGGRVPDDRDREGARGADERGGLAAVWSGVSGQSWGGDASATQESPSSSSLASSAASSRPNCSSSCSGAASTSMRASGVPRALEIAPRRRFARSAAYCTSSSLSSPNGFSAGASAG